MIRRCIAFKIITFDESIKKQSMSEKKSLIIIGVILVGLIVFVYQFSTPKKHMHLAPVTGDIEKSLPAKDTSSRADSSK